MILAFASTVPNPSSDTSSLDELMATPASVNECPRATVPGQSDTPTGAMTSTIGNSNSVA
ncbi:MAG: hypothetical protein BWY91_02469 [bacterium ADurb.BinA028]|nr:MAG: hypothetical protein BWY91_02469 [bacterium ADurb.BinA028]